MFNNRKKRIKELEDALIEIYERSSYDLNENISRRNTVINNEKFESIYKRIGLPKK